MSMESYTVKAQSTFPRKGLVHGVCARAGSAVAAGPACTSTPAPDANPHHLHERLRLYMETVGLSQGSVAQVLGLPVRRLNYYLTEKSEVNLWPLLPSLLQADPRISREWLYFGEGSMWTYAQRGQLASSGDPYFLAASHSAASLSPPFVDPPMQLTWLVGCNEQGWFSKSYMSVNVSPPQCGPDWIAVLVSGDALAPCGLRDGYTLFCDPAQKPGTGEIVYALRNDGSATIKVYQGLDSKKRIMLQGWLPSQGATPKTYMDSCAPEDLACLAPLIYVKCRL